MLATLGLLALAVLGAEGPPQAKPVTPRIIILEEEEVLGAEGPPQAKPEPAPLTYQLQVYEMKGLDWRAAVHERLQPVARQGGATIWTANRTTARELASLADSVKQAPPVTARSGVPVHVAPGASERDVTRVQQASFTPDEKALRPKCSATFTGRKLDQGVLTKFVLEETRILAVHQVAYSSTKGTPVNSIIGVPEVASSDVIGEWLIPNDGALVISLGVHTVAAADGKAEVRERLVVLEASTAANPPAVQAMWKPTRIGPPLAGLPRPMLVAPSRALPQPFRPDGKPAELPPLPDDVTPTSLPDSSEPCASPQARFAPEPDKALQRTTYKMEIGPLPMSAAPLAVMAAEGLQGVLDWWTGADEYQGMVLPSGKYRHDDVRYFPPPPTLPAREGVKSEDDASVPPPPFVPVAPPVPPEAKPSAAIPLPPLPGKESEE